MTLLGEALLLGLFLAVPAKIGGGDDGVGSSSSTSSWSSSFSMKLFRTSLMVQYSNPIQRG